MVRSTSLPPFYVRPPQQLPAPGHCAKPCLKPCVKKVTRLKPLPPGVWDHPLPRDAACYIEFVRVWYSKD